MIFVSFGIVMMISTIIWILQRGYLYKRSEYKNIIREIVLFLFFLYFLLLLKLTVFKRGGIEFTNPLNSYSYKVFGIKGIINFVPFVETIKTLTDGHTPMSMPLLNIYGNVLAFMPLGFLIPLLFDRFNDFKRIFFLGVTSSFFIEFTQLFIAGNSCDIDDIIYNSSGAVLGWICFKVFEKIIDQFNLIDKFNNIRDLDRVKIFKQSSKVVLSIGVVIVITFIYSYFDQTVSGNLSNLEMATEVLGYNENQILDVVEVKDEKFYLIKDEFGITIKNMRKYVGNRYNESTHGYSVIEKDDYGYMIDFAMENINLQEDSDEILPIVFGKNKNASTLVLNINGVEYKNDLKLNEYFMVIIPEMIKLSKEKIYKIMAEKENSNSFNIKFIDKDGKVNKEMINLENIGSAY